MTHSGSSKTDGGGAGNRAVRDISFGSLAGICGKLVEFPFDTIKVRLQAQPLSNDGSGRKMFSGPVDCLQKTVRNEGFMGLYKGLSSPLVGAIVENATLFVTYSYLKDVFRQYWPNPTSSSSSTAPDSTDNDADLTLTQLFVAGALSGTVASFLLTPIELVKCKLQVQEVGELYGNKRPTSATLSSHSSAESKRSYSTNTNTTKKSKLSQKSSKPTIPIRPSPPKPVGLHTISALPFAGHFPDLSHLFSSSSSNTVASSASSASSTRYYTGPLSVIRHIYRYHGVLGFYRGHLGTMIRETGGSAAWFGIYEVACQYFISKRIHSQSLSSGQPKSFTKSDLSTAELLFAGALAGMSYNIVLFPADVIKSRMQTEEEMARSFRSPSTATSASTSSHSSSHSSSSIHSRGFVKVGTQLYKTEGFKGLYRGLGITLIRSAPASAVIFGTFEWLNRLFPGS